MDSEAIGNRSLEGRVGRVDTGQPPKCRLVIRREALILTWHYSNRGEKAVSNGSWSVAYITETLAARRHRSKPWKEGTPLRTNSSPRHLRGPGSHSQQPQRCLLSVPATPVSEKATAP